MSALKDWPQIQSSPFRRRSRYLYQVVAVLCCFLLLWALRGICGSVGRRVQEGLSSVLKTEWNYQPVLERVVRHGLEMVNADLPFFGEMAKPVVASVEPVPFLPVSGQAVRGFGWTKDAVSGLEQFHNGIDIKVAPGEPVKAVADGEVVKIGADPAMGFYLLLDHGKGITTLYAPIEKLTLAIGGQVKGGQVIGFVGTKGDVLPGGLHFEYRQNGRPVDPVHKVFSGLPNGNEQ